MANPWLDDLTSDGIAMVPDIFSAGEVDGLLAHLSPLVGDGAGERGLHDDPFISSLAVRGPFASLANSVLQDARVVRVLYFDKHAGANWKVPYHQDVTIAVNDRLELPGFSGWSTKAGMVHVRAPDEVLRRMIAIRLHLDDCGPDNGPLRVVVGSHHGRIEKSTIPQIIAERGERTFPAPRGAAILMRPLLLHASSPAASPTHRRVLHIEYAAGDLPSPLNWALGWSAETDNFDAKIGSNGNCG